MYEPNLQKKGSNMPYTSQKIETTNSSERLGWNGIWKLELVMSYLKQADKSEQILSEEQVCTTGKFSKSRNLDVGFTP